MSKPPMPFPSTRAGALERLERFVPLAGAHYANGRNSDPGPDAARDYVAAAASDTAARVVAHFGCSADVLVTLDAAALLSAAREAGVRQIVTACAPVGPGADRLAALAPVLAGEGIALVQVRRRWDAQFWPHAKKGYFAFKERIPELLRADGLAA